MTAYAVYTRALSYVFERVEKDKDFKEFFPAFLNTAMQEALPYENAIRRKNEDTELTTFTDVTADTINDELEFSESLCRAALPYGVAAFYYQDEGNDYRANDYRQRFINALTDAVNGVRVTDIEDVYGYGEGAYINA